MSKTDTLVDRVKLRSEMFVNGISTTTMCERMKISRTSFYSKMHNRVEFTESEILVIIAFFGTRVFFDLLCVQNAHKRKEVKHDIRRKRVLSDES